MPFNGISTLPSYLPSFNGQAKSQASTSAQALQVVKNGSGVGRANPLTLSMGGNSSQPPATLLDMVSKTFDTNRPETLRLNQRSGVVEGHPSLRPTALSAIDLPLADAHASGLEHALMIGAGKDPSPERIRAINERRPGLVGQQAGIDMKAVGFVLQAAESSGVAGNQVDAVEKALTKVVDKLISPKLSPNSLGTYDGKQASEGLLRALKDLKKATTVLINDMGGVDSVLQETAKTQVHDRLLQNLHQEFPTAFEDGVWVGLQDEQGNTITPDVLMDRYSAALIQARSEVYDNHETFDQFQGKAQELLKLITRHLKRDDSPEQPPTPPAPKNPPNNEGPGSGPGPGGNWNHVDGGKVGDITVTAHPASGGNSDAVAIEALKVVGRANELLASKFSEALNLVSNRRTSVDSGVGDDRASMISEADAELMGRLDDLLSVGDRSAGNQHGNDDRVNDESTPPTGPASWKNRPPAIPPEWKGFPGLGLGGANTGGVRFESAEVQENSDDVPDDGPVFSYTRSTGGGDDLSTRKHQDDRASFSRNRAPELPRILSGNGWINRDGGWVSRDTPATVTTSFGRGTSALDLIANPLHRSLDSLADATRGESGSSSSPVKSFSRNPSVDESGVRGANVQAEPLVENDGGVLAKTAVAQPQSLGLGGFGSNFPSQSASTAGLPRSANSANSETRSKIKEWAQYQRKNTWEIPKRGSNVVFTHGRGTSVLDPDLRISRGEVEDGRAAAFGGIQGSTASEKLDAKLLSAVDELVAWSRSVKKS